MTPREQRWTYRDPGGRPSIDYIVVAFRSALELTSCLDAIAADAPRGAGVIVIDNASPDDSAAIAAAHSVRARVVVSTTNLGFGGGCNLGVRSSTADLIFFVNPDARLRPGVTAKLVASLSAMNRPGIAAPRIVDPSGESRVAQAGAEPSLRSALGYFFLLGSLPVFGRLFPPLHLANADAVARPDWVSGAAQLVSRAAFDEVSGFDERMFMYMEDVDFCRRVRAVHRQIAYVPEALVEHRMGASQGDEQPIRWFRSFHRYVRTRQGELAARAVSFIATIGLAARSIGSRRTRPINAKRVRRASLEALRLALAPNGRPEDR